MYFILCILFYGISAQCVFKCELPFEKSDMRTRGAHSEAKYIQTKKRIVKRCRCRPNESERLAALVAAGHKAQSGPNTKLQNISRVHTLGFWLCSA